MASNESKWTDTGDSDYFCLETVRYLQPGRLCKISSWGDSTDHRISHGGPGVLFPRRFTSHPETNPSARSVESATAFSSVGVLLVGLGVARVCAVCVCGSVFTHECVLCACVGVHASDAGVTTYW